MQYLSDRLQATKTGGPREGGGEQRHPGVGSRQRRRLLDATEQLAAERGVAGATIERIAKRARVSSVSFYDHYGSREEVVVAAFERAVAEAQSGLAAAVPTGLDWPDQVRTGLRALLAMIAAEPARATLCLVEAQRGGEALEQRYETMLDLAVPKLRQGRLLVSATEDLPEALEEATVAGVAWLLREQLEAGGAESIEELLPRLLDIVLSPYLGEGEALRLAVAAGSA